MQRIAQGRDHARVVAVSLVARVHQHDGTPGRWRQLAAQGIEAVGVSDLNALLVAEVGIEDAMVGGG